MFDFLYFVEHIVLVYKLKVSGDPKVLILVLNIFTDDRFFIFG